MKKFKRALISVSDKEGIDSFARELASLGVEIVSTGGTAMQLAQNGIPVIKVADVTGFPEILDGRVKTLNPKIHGGILARRNTQDHMNQLASHGITPIDIVAVNLYPFEKTILKPGCTLDDAVENIDIGGPAMVRAAAKNHQDVIIIVDPADYARVIEALRSGTDLSAEARRELALKAYAHTAAYDSMISGWLRGTLPSLAETWPAQLSFTGRLESSLRYGENPHQRAALYSIPGIGRETLARAKQLQGKELSFNNILDTHAAWELVKEFKNPAAAIIKHNNPCGAASDGNLLNAFKMARDTDPVSAFGGIIALNRAVTPELAKEINLQFVEVIIAPEYDKNALAEFAQKKNLRLLQVPLDSAGGKSSAEISDIRIVDGGYLVQTRDDITLDSKQLKIVSKRKPTDTELESLKFGWIVCKHVKSNAIIFTRGTETIGIGAGQMSRIDSVELARRKAKKPVENCMMASDAFFPFRDGIDAAHSAGVTAIIQPGGSVRDDEVIAAADEHGMAMVFTGIRHFRH